mmetsp:Transcript_181/g.670  ORF Transcript_181/g.670 Transcript_181/m.670 type:complete len:203 (-) Transcript_181:634-1242(-)
MRAAMVRRPVHRQCRLFRKRHPHERRRLARRGLEVGGDARRQRGLQGQQIGLIQDADGVHPGRLHPRGPHRRRPRARPGARVRGPDEDSTRVAGRPQHRRRRGERGAAAPLRGAPACLASRRGQGAGGAVGVVGGQGGARPRPAQDAPHVVGAARQAGRLPARRGGRGDLHRRGRLRRRFGQAGPRPRDAGHLAAAGQDFER